MNKSKGKRNWGAWTRRMGLWVAIVAFVILFARAASMERIEKNAQIKMGPSRGSLIIAIAADDIDLQGFLSKKKILVKKEDVEFNNQYWAGMFWGSLNKDCLQIRRNITLPSPTDTVYVFGNFIK